MPLSLKTIHARLLILDIPKPSHSLPVITQLSLLTFVPDPTQLATGPLAPHLQDRVIEKGKQLVGHIHSYAAHLMDSYGEQYIVVETDEELGINIRFRGSPVRGRS